MWFPTALCHVVLGLTLTIQIFVSFIYNWQTINVLSYYLITMASLLSGKCLFYYYDDDDFHHVTTLNIMHTEV